jgi:hypothetical protein
VYNGSASTATVTGLTANTTYHFQIFDYKGGVNVENYNLNSAANNPRSATTLFSEPTTQSSNIIFSGLNPTSLTLTWTKGNGTERILVGRMGSAVSATPADGTAYTGNSNFNAAAELSVGQKILYRGNSNTATITNLTANTVYHFQVFELNGTATQSNYLLTTAALNPANRSTLVAEPTAQPTGISFSAITENSMNVSFTAAAGTPNGYIALLKQGSSPTDVPADGGSYTVASTIGTSTVKYIGSATNFSINGLAANTTYYLDVFSYNGTSDTYNFLTSSPLQGSQITTTVAPTLSDPASIGQSSFQLSWPAVTGASNYALDVSLDNFNTFVSGYSNKLLGKRYNYISHGAR